jgi:dolichol kinase
MSEAIALNQAVTTERRRTADRVFRGALAYTAALSLLWVFFLATGQTFGLFSTYAIDRDALLRVLFGFLFFSVLWGVIWYGVKSLCLRFFVGFSKEERRLAFASRMSEPFDLSALLARHSERRIRIADMIGRRGRFLTIQLAFYWFLYSQIAKDPKPVFLGMGLQDGLFDAVVLSWVALALYYSNGFLARAFWGAQSRVMDGSLARANCLLITTLWSAFKFVMVPIGGKLALLFPPSTYAPLFIFIWGSYAAADHSSEIVGSLFGKQKLRVWGIGDLNRKSLAGTGAAFLASLSLCSWAVYSHHLPASWWVLAVVISASNTLLELFSPRGTDDFTMATGNALLCWAFGLMSFVR